MEIVIISLVSFLASILTFFSGFGLGTILMPVFMIFFPVNIAIALTGIVHFLSSLFKVFLVGKEADKQIVLRFGIPAVLAALAGAWLLLQLSDWDPLFRYMIGSKKIEVLPVKFFVAILLFFFVIIDFIPYFKNLEFGKDKLPIGGILSGFFGGLSGVQGALRSAFLVKMGLSKEAFIATTSVIACMVDLTRLSVYATRFMQANLYDSRYLVLSVTLSAIAGVYLGNLLLKKVSLKLVQVLVSVMLVLITIALGAGLI